MNTYQEIRNILGQIEPDEKMYLKISIDDLPHLKRLVKDKESWMVARAIYALARLKNEEAYKIIQNARSDPRSEVRIAAAVASTRLPKDIAETIIYPLLKDEDIGVRKFAIKSIPPRSSDIFKNRLLEISLEDDNELIRNLSREKLSKKK